MTQQELSGTEVSNIHISDCTYAEIIGNIAQEMCCVQEMFVSSVKEM